MNLFYHRPLLKDTYAPGILKMYQLNYPQIQVIQVFLSLL